MLTCECHACEKPNLSEWEGRRIKVARSKGRSDGSWNDVIDESLERVAWKMKQLAMASVCCNRIQWWNWACTVGGSRVPLRVRNWLPRSNWTVDVLWPLPSITLRDGIGSTGNFKWVARRGWMKLSELYWIKSNLHCKATDGARKSNSSSARGKHVKRDDAK